MVRIFFLNVMMDDFISSFTSSRENGINVAFYLKTNADLMNFNSTLKQTKHLQTDFHTV